MEYCDAGNLADVVQDGALAEEQASYITREVFKLIIHDETL
jgi:hypothetical protein